MTPENFTHDQIRELVPEGFIRMTPHGMVRDSSLAVAEALLTTRLELKQARERLASVADDALEYALMARSEVIDDNRPRYQRQRDLIDADLAKFRAIIDGHPAPPETQAPSLAGDKHIKNVINGWKKSWSVSLSSRAEGALRDRFEKLAATITARIAELEGALKTPNIDSICLSFRHDFGLLSEEARESIRYDCREWAQAIMKEILE